MENKIIKFKDFIIIETKKGYSVFQNEKLICKLNFNYELVDVLRSLTIEDLKEIYAFLKK